MFVALFLLLGFAVTASALCLNAKVNTFLLPHIGSATIETRTAMGMVILDSVDKVLSGSKVTFGLAFGDER